MNPTHLNLTDFAKVVMGCPPAALTGAPGDGDYVSMKNYSKLTVLIAVLNATTVTGGAVTLKQATNVAGASEKALSFSKAWRNIDCAAADTLAEFAVVSDTFTTDATNSKQLLYVLEIDASSLDGDNGFDTVRAKVNSMNAAVASVVYILHPTRYGNPLALPAITD